MPVKSPQSTLQKYRPAFTSDQIEHILAVCQMDCDSEVATSIVKILVPLQAKIKGGLIEPAYKLSEKLITAREDKTEQYRYENDLMSEAEASAYEAKILGIL